MDITDHDFGPGAQTSEVTPEMASSDKLAEIKQRYRDDPNMYWVSEVDWLLGEVERLRAALEQIAEGAHGVYLATGIGTRLTHRQSRASPAKRWIDLKMVRSDKSEITDEMVERLARFLQTEWAGPYMAHVRDYLPDGIEPGPERDRAIAALQAADWEAEAEARRVAREALRAAFGA
jgi:hypothetical protein